MKMFWFAILFSIVITSTPSESAVIRAVPSSAALVLAGVPREHIQDLGGVAPLMPMHLAVVLKLTHERDLDALVGAQRDPYSPIADRALTVEQFRNYFSPTVAAYGRTAVLLNALDLRVERTYANRTVMDVTGPAEVVERAFGTALHRVRYGRFIGYANLRPALMPAELRATVAGIVGFDNLPILHTDNVRGLRDVRRLTAGKSLLGPDGGYGPLAFEDAYDFPTLHGSDGNGQATGVVMDADYLDSDLSGFLKYFGIRRAGPATTRVPIDGANPGIRGDSVETTLDVDTIVGLAPAIKLYLYMPQALQYQSVMDAYAEANSDDKVGALNSSFSGCENLAGSFVQLANQLAKEGAALGIIYAAATGDYGSDECNVAGSGPLLGPAVATPASGPAFIAVGGTTIFLDPNGKRLLENAWSGSGGISSEASGGGFSDKFPEPAYQYKVQRLGSRALPDIAFDANPGSGLAFYFQGKWQGPIGGTSLATPIFCALATELDQIHGRRITTMHTILYDTLNKFGYSQKRGAVKAFNDITNGYNGYFYAQQGFDEVTGIGSIDGWNFAKNGVGL